MPNCGSPRCCETGVHAIPEYMMNRDYEEFMIYCYKVLPCQKAYRHDWWVCPFAHEGETAKRRDPRKFRYTAVACPDAKQGKPCPRGDSCPGTHNVFEYWLHPTRYRTEFCGRGQHCNRPFCFFAHSANEVRRPGMELRRPAGVPSLLAFDQDHNQILPMQDWPLETLDSSTMSLSAPLSPASVCHHDVALLSSPQKISQPHMAFTRTQDVLPLQKAVSADMVGLQGMIPPPPTTARVHHQRSLSHSHVGRKSSGYLNNSSNLLGADLFSASIAPPVEAKPSTIDLNTWQLVNNASALGVDLTSSLDVENLMSLKALLQSGILNQCLAGASQEAMLPPF